MLPTPVIFMVGAGLLVLLSIVVLVSTGSIFALAVMLGLVGIAGYILYQQGVLKISSKNGELDVSFFEKAPAPSSAPKQIIPAKALPLEQKEVFYIAGNSYTYDEAPAVCAAYDADLASYDQVNDAYSKGAEWCGYGWTQGGMALFPTQESTWETLQGEMDIQKKTACGRPGINGGYFDPSTKFGVNCYGIKPSSKSPMKFPQPVPGEDSKAFDNMVQKFKNMIGQMSISPFNRLGWSEWSATSHLPAAVTTTLKKDL